MKKKINKEIRVKIIKNVFVIALIMLSGSLLISIANADIKYYLFNI